MDCIEDKIHPPPRINLHSYDYLHPQGQHLISGWFNRAWDARNSNPEECFEPFIYAWFAVNGWAACITDKNIDKDLINALTDYVPLCERFVELVSDKSTHTATYALQFAELWPIFEVKTLRAKRIDRYQTGNRREIVNTYLAAGADRFEPQCWNKHMKAHQSVPLDWPHTLAAIYKVRCNLFHGEKAAHSEMDQRVVSSAFKVLVHFMREGHYLNFLHDCQIIVHSTAPHDTCGALLCACTRSKARAYTP